MGIHVVETFLDRVCEALYDLRMLFKIAFFCTVGRVRDVAGIFSEGCDYIAVSFLLQGSGEGLELDGVIEIIARECRGGEAEADALVDGEILCWINAVFL